MKFILGKKVGMTQVFAKNGEVVPVTKVIAGPCQVVQVKDGKQDNQVALQIGFEKKAAFRMKKPQTGHLKDLENVQFLRDFGIEKVEGIERGDVITVSTFTPGDIVSVIGTSKGKGFAGVVKRHHFRGAPASHGHKHDLRAPGSIGAGGVQRVFKGMRMAGRMGGDRVTVKNLEIVEVNSQTNELLIKGAVPGGKNGLLLINGIGDLKIEKQAKAAEIKTETAPEAAGAPQTA
ncbi:MAG: 50S ribosomal protein L3 [Candidatus Magasanikbacteria bacterium RIFCSPLOWO2_02_FULL_44_11]|uniref:Large ribosomal subunit protein uL3 n=1 Tax=Candidatus Magasanikbacteria bacterium RIFCSPLOWO2_02_FULL_44_11 TaxID=1798689 RepID=A0A1F6N9D6_9BACT|nr:MAG: 50S ribosomal protein L3 [Candidatus Magasanikbacteria bacterium RIFCSPLOWO2_02_FULL_44_11]